MPVLNVYDNVALPVTFDKGKHINRKYIEELLKELGIWDKRKKYPNELSGGQQQRVAIARALINNPAVLFADEPSGNLDTKTKDELHNLFFHLREKYGQTIVIVTHDPDLAKMCDRSLYMVDGQFV